MKLTDNDKQFLKDSKEILKRLFNERITDLRVDIEEEKAEERDKIVEAIRENKRWIIDIDTITNDKKPRVDTGI